MVSLFVQRSENMSACCDAAAKYAETSNCQLKRTYNVHTASLTLVRRTISCCSFQNSAPYLSRFFYLFLWFKRHFLANIVTRLGYATQFVIVFNSWKFVGASRRLWIKVSIRHILRSVYRDVFVLVEFLFCLTACYRNEKDDQAVIFVSLIEFKWLFKWFHLHLL